jgi:hypothetical protein
MELVTDYPVWQDHPYQVPPEIEVRRAPGAVVLWWPKHQIHVEIKKPVRQAAVKIGLLNLAGCAFEKAHPGEILKLFRRRATTAVNGEEISEKDKALWAEYNKFN